MPYKNNMRFHVFYSLKYIKYGLLIGVVPVVQALIKLDFYGVVDAFMQGGFILLACAAVAIFLWWNTSFSLSDKCITVKSRAIYKHSRIYDKNSIAAVNISRPLYYRIFYAARVTLYFKNHVAPKKLTLILPKNTAQKVVGTLMPLNRDNSVFEPAGTERFMLILISANAITTALFIYFTARSIADILGRNIVELAGEAQENIIVYEQILRQILPAGLALLISVFFAFTSVMLMYSFITTWGLKVCRSGGVILCKCGIFSKTERRIKVNCINSCEVRVTLAARLLRRYPLYVTAGSFEVKDFPVMVFKKHLQNSPSLLLPDYISDSGHKYDNRQKSLMQFLWRPLLYTAAALCLYVVLGVQNSSFLAMVWVAVVPGIYSILLSVEGYFKEGLRTNSNYTLSMCYTRFFARYHVCIFAKDTMYTLYHSPFLKKKKRATVSVKLPCGVKHKARGVPLYDSMRLKFYA